MERFYFPKPMVANGSFGMNFVFVNSREEKLSIAGDNSHVADHTIRHSYAIFAKDGTTIKEDTYIADALELTRVIAKHMGYEVA